MAGGFHATDTDCNLVVGGILSRANRLRIPDIGVDCE